MSRSYYRWAWFLSLFLTLHTYANPEVTDENIFFSGITIHIKEKFIDLDATVCLDAGSLELIACSEMTKEHESIVTVTAKPMHIHAALLLLGGKPAEPLNNNQESDTDEPISEPFMGGKIEVSLITADDKSKEEVRPIADFVRKIEEEPVFIGQSMPENVDRSFPTSQFRFIGSFLIKNKNGSTSYAAGDSGNIISISFFGDELLGLPDAFGHENSDLIWEIDPKYLPKVGTKVKLRLKPL